MGRGALVVSAVVIFALCLGAAVGVLWLGPTTLDYCREAGGLNGLYLQAAERTVGVVHIDGGAERFPNCYVPSPLAWVIAFTVAAGGLVAGVGLGLRAARSRAVRA